MSETTIWCVTFRLFGLWPVGSAMFTRKNTKDEAESVVRRTLPWFVRWAICCDATTPEEMFELAEIGTEHAARVKEGEVFH